VARAIAILRNPGARLGWTFCVTVFIAILATAYAGADCPVDGAPLVWNAGHPCSADATDASCRLEVATSNSRGGDAAIAAAALVLASEYDAAASRDRSFNLGAAEAYLIAAASEAHAGLAEDARRHYQLVIARVDTAPSSGEGQCARRYATAGLDRLDILQSRTRWIPQHACTARNQNDDDCALGRYSAEPASAPPSAIDMAHRLARHYKGLFIFNAPLAARAFTIAAQFELRAGRSAEARSDLLSARALDRTPPIGVLADSIVSPQPSNQVRPPEIDQRATDPPPSPERPQPPEH
jgi:hypothetical protein